MLRGSIDKQALERARSGERGALRFLYMRHEAKVRRGLVEAVGDDELAEDMTQALFAELSGDASDGSPEAGTEPPESPASASPCESAAA
jgi:DNA-directed RNA polymerase specialized sigma24 family protein